MILGTTVAGLRHGFARSLVGFRDDERGSMTLIITFMFILMIMWGGIAVDVMRYETRRVTLQQTLDRAALAAASLQQTRTPQQIVEDWFSKSGLETETLKFVDYSQAVVVAQNDAGLRKVNVRADVFSQNFFMSWYSPRDFFQSPLQSEAAQGVSQIEVMMVLDITGSMGESLGGGKTKIQALREAATNFVDIVKGNDTKNQISIGIVPYAAQVNIPVNLRQQFNVTNVSSWYGVPNAGVPNRNCVEFPTSSFGSTGYSLTDPLPMAAVADARSDSNTSGNYQSPQGPTNVTCVDGNGNLVLLPTKDGNVVKSRIAALRDGGNTYIAVGMRWGTALMDQAARPIYTAIGDVSVQGRPADNADDRTRKIIILMTDGEHVENMHVRDAYKSGPSPIWRGADGRFAVRFWPGGTNFNDNARPPCAGANEYFVPHLQSGTSCAAAAWVSSPSWSGSGAVVQLDWSEVWRYVRVSWVAQQLYVRSNVTGTGNLATVRDQMRTVYLTNTTNMDNLLQQNCAAARALPSAGGGGIEIYGIMFDDRPSTRGIAAIYGCSSLPKTTYYYEPRSAADLTSVFNAIATDISDLRLTQ
ncbi:MAG: pilus assembly protein TadG-related protein [Tabrizicola sp.]|nr:pilus assembly protein TadG-related protein [Tabrizicola sp.]